MKAGRSRAVAFIAAALFLFSFFLSQREDIQTIESKFHDELFHYTSCPAVEKIVIVDMGETFPVSRAELITTLNFLRDKKLAAIGIDVLLFSEPGSDAEVAEALKGFNNVVIPYIEEVHQKVDGNQTLQIRRNLSGIYRGFVEGEIDGDGVVRSVRLVKKGTLLSFGLIISSLYETGSAHIRQKKNRVVVNQGLQIPLDNRGFLKIFYYSNNNFPVFSCKDLKQQPWKQLEGSIVLIGSTTQPGDLFRTPLSHHYPGVLIHAQVINTILGKHFLSSLPPFYNAALIFLLALLSSSSIVVMRRLYLGVFIVLTLLGGYILISISAFLLLSTVMPVIVPAVTILLSTTASLLYRIREAETMLAGGSAPVSIEKGRTPMPVSPDSEKALSGQPFRELSSGSVLGKFTILEKIGSGGMGDVYLVEHRALMVKRALKIIRPELLINHGMKERFRVEAVATAHLEDPSIIVVHDYEEIDSIPCIEMEYFESYSLRAELKRNAPFDAQRVLEVAGKIRDGLKCAHQALPGPLIHRDLKPENILISVHDRKKLKIIDFGLVKVLEEGQNDESKTTNPLGTPYYMAPEQILSEPVGPFTDIYSMGVILFEMITGRKPFEEESYLQILNAHLKTPVPSASALNPAFAPAVDEVIKKSMEKESARRYQHVDEVVIDLEKALTKGGEPYGNKPFEKTL